MESVRIRKDEETQKVKRVEHDLLKIYEKKDKYYILESGIRRVKKLSNDNSMYGIRTGGI